MIIVNFPVAPEFPCLFTFPHFVPSVAFHTLSSYVFRTMIGYMAMVPASTFFPPSLSSFCVLLPNFHFDLWRWRQNNPLIVTWIDYEQIGLIALLCDYVQIFRYHQNKKWIKLKNETSMLMVFLSDRNRTISNLLSKTFLKKIVKLHNLDLIMS